MKQYNAERDKEREYWRTRALDAERKLHAKDTHQPGDGYTFIQWKGTDVCMDVTCPKCGEHGHIDGEFVYAVQCDGCKTIWELGWSVGLREVKNNWKGCEPWWFGGRYESTPADAEHDHTKAWRERLERTKKLLEEMDAPKPQRPPLDTERSWIFFPGASF
jgi:hypothetical protein